MSEEPCQTDKAKAATAEMGHGSHGDQQDHGQRGTAAALPREANDIPSTMTNDRLAGIIGAWVGFSSSCIKSGESWSPACERMKNDAFAALNELADRADRSVSAPTA